MTPQEFAQSVVADVPELNDGRKGIFGIDDVLILTTIVLAAVAAVTERVINGWLDNCQHKSPSEVIVSRSHWVKKHLYHRLAPKVEQADVLTDAVYGAMVRRVESLGDEKASLMMKQWKEAPR